MQVTDYKSIVGIDPSLTATAVFQTNGKSIVHEVFSSKPAKTLRGRMDRFTRLSSQIIGALRTESPQLILIEGYSFGSRGSGVVTLGEFGGILRNWLLNYGNVLEISPSTLKQFATGKGNASKCAVVAGLTKRYGVEFKTDDEYDAFALMKLGECLAGWSEAQTAIQQKVVNDIMKAEGL